jgi:hypothetical protein
VPVGVPLVRAAFGGDLKPALVATQGGTGDGRGFVAFVPPIAYRLVTRVEVVDG